MDKSFVERRRLGQLCSWEAFLLPAITAIGETAPAISAISSGVGLAENLFGGGGSSGPTAPQTPATIPASSQMASAVAPGTTPGDFRNQQNAFYQQMLAGLGMGQPGGQLPADIQQNIDRQASLIGG